MPTLKAVNVGGNITLLDVALLQPEFDLAAPEKTLLRVGQKLVTNLDCCCGEVPTVFCESCLDNKAPVRFLLNISGHIDCPFGGGFDCSSNYTVFNGDHYLYDVVLDSEENTSPSSDCVWDTAWNDAKHPDPGSIPELPDADFPFRKWFQNFYVGDDCHLSVGGPPMPLGQLEGRVSIAPAGEPPWRLSLRVQYFAGVVSLADHLLEFDYDPTKPDCMAIDETDTLDIITDCGLVTITYHLTSA